MKALRSLRRLMALMRKEVTQLLRDRRTLAYMIGLPLVELFLFAYAVSLTVTHLPTAVVDLSHDARSRALLADLANSQYFDLTLDAYSAREAGEAIDRGQVKAAVVIPPDFASSLARGSAEVLFLIDGSDSFSIQSGYQAATAIAENYSFRLNTQAMERAAGTGTAASLQASTRVLYNPDMNDLWFILPGICAMIIQTLAVAQAAMAVVRERETGTVEQILVTPTRPLEMILSKMIPLGVLITLINWIVIAFAIFWFKVPFQGDPWVFFWLTLIFVLSTLGLGLLISTVARTQRQAQQMSAMIMVFTMMLAGIVYPRAAMPPVAQWIGNLLPLTYFLRIARGIITRGVGVQVVSQDVIILAGYTLLVLLVSAFSFRKRLD